MLLLALYNVTSGTIQSYFWHYTYAHLAPVELNRFSVVSQYVRLSGHRIYLSVCVSLAAVVGLLSAYGSRYIRSGKINPVFHVAAFLLITGYALEYPHLKAHKDAEKAGAAH
ncbi:hypothetical protein SARC_00399 [Sphaeroforma arctica JP610]|uniref:Uncharacterized protein n=1 Tax=Sphaeroforma arctica JP610 TaxID=667725 RepID=A0A0L0GF70_9EUKA|nr:hypothetical protein SARC_00399 [Sphaeroforma arctica JP610]KNC87514.1 hypothetical protein SARC_00399 [Sphaeroforma arctica JP610]|eukprot:XP_014161416.1 hypothetical protein SARC_00399 [Sphaeroforma arctica JP610]